MRALAYLKRIAKPKHPCKAFSSQPETTTINGYTWALPEHVGSETDTHKQARQHSPTRKNLITEEDLGEWGGRIIKGPNTRASLKWRRRGGRIDESKMPELPFDFMYSYSETPKVRPIGFREPCYSPFRGQVQREWNGWCAPARRTGVSSVDSMDEEYYIPRNPSYRTKEEIQGEPLTEDEIDDLVVRFHPRRTKRRIEIGRDGVTHNMIWNINLIWRDDPAVRMKCLGVSTIDMKNICTKLEDKTRGKVIYQCKEFIMLYRGRNYTIQDFPKVPLMAWRPRSPIYPDPIAAVVPGLSSEESTELRERGLRIPALITLSKKNGFYGSLVKMVQKAFKYNDLVKIDCRYLPSYEEVIIGTKLRDLVPCILVKIYRTYIVIWRGKNPYSDVACSSTTASSISSVNPVVSSAVMSPGLDTHFQHPPVDTHFQDPEINTLRTCISHQESSLKTHNSLQKSPLRGSNFTIKQTGHSDVS